VEAIKADFLEMRSVVTTLEDVLAARGRNLAKVIESAKRVAEALDGAQLVSDADTRKVTQNGMLQTAPRAAAPAA
jgi:capsid protein